MSAPNGFAHFDPWWAGLRRSFNPINDLSSQLAAYWETQTPDAAYETLPGSTLATDQNDGIGAVLDIKRYRERGPELVTNGTFDADLSGWSNAGVTAEWSAGRMRLIHTDGGGRYQDIAVEPETIYEITFDVESVSGSQAARLVVYDSDGFTVPPLANIYDGRMLVKTKAGQTAMRVYCYRPGAGEEYWDNVSVREIPGYHAIQEVAANQPVLNIENGVRSASFITDDVLPFPNSLSTFNFLHDGTGGEVSICCRVNDLDNAYFLFGNNGSSPNGAGVTLGVSQAGALFLRLGNGSGTYLSELASASGVVVPGEKMVVGYSLGSDGQVSMYKNGQRIAGPSAIVGQPSAADAQYNFVVGLPREGSSVLAASMDYYSMAPTTAVLTDYQRQRLATYMLRRAGA